MRTSHELSNADDCLCCRLRANYSFCDLPLPELRRLNEIRSIAVYPRSAILFAEGQQARGVFLLCTGRAKLSASSTNGKTLITKLAGPGEVLGLSSTILNQPYEVTAEMAETGQVNFIPRNALLQFLREHGEVSLRLSEELSRNYFTAHETVCALGLAHSPSQKFAKLLLSWLAEAGDSGDPPRIRLTLTQEEIAEMLGTSRETISRLFSAFKKNQLLERKGSTLIIRNKRALEELTCV